ncbi:MAG: hypothetical protein KDD64_07010 [Bdellovibrionales bacterium]|nr:hypothetical protein [Bdellovibrionales bacterium]
MSRTCVFPGLVSLLIGFLGCSATPFQSSRSVGPSRAESVLFVFAGSVNRSEAYKAFHAVRSVVRDQAQIELRQWEKSLLSPPQCFQGCTHRSFIANWERALRHLKEHEYVLVFLSPDESLFRQAMDGFAIGSRDTQSTRGKFALVTIGDDSDYNQRVLLHELGHLLGALHTQSGIMRSGITRKTPLIFSERSLREIQTRRTLQFASY